MLDKFNEYLLPIFLIIQPILDVLVVICPNLYISQIVRGIFMIYMMIYLFFYTDKWKQTIVIVPLMLIYIIYNYLYLSSSVIASLSNTMKLFYLIFILYFFKNIKLEKKLSKYLLITLYEYLSIYLLSYIFRVGYSNYPKGVKKIGYRALFNSINEISAILVILYYTLFSYLKDKKILLILTTILISIISYLTGTKVLFGGLLITIIIYCFKDIKNIIKKQNTKMKILSCFSSIILLLIISFLFLNSNTYKNMIVQAKFFKVKNIFSYEGINKVIFNDRLNFLVLNHKEFLSSTLLKKIFGLGFDFPLKTVEIDIFDIIYRYGFVAFILILSVFKKMFVKIKDKKLLFGLIIIILISSTSGHVLISPAVCIYIGLIYYLKTNEVKE